MNTILELVFKFYFFIFTELIIFISFIKIKMVNSKLSKKFLKSRSLKLKNKRTKKSKVSRKNVRKMKGGVLLTLEQAKQRLKEIKELFNEEKYIEILKLNTNSGKLEYNLTNPFLESSIIEYYDPNKYESLELKEIIKECLSLVLQAHTQAQSAARAAAPPTAAEVAEKEAASAIVAARTAAWEAAEANRLRQEEEQNIRVNFVYERILSIYQYEKKDQKNLIEQIINQQENKMCFQIAKKIYYYQKSLPYKKNKEYADLTIKLEQCAQILYLILLRLSFFMKNDSKISNNAKISNRAKNSQVERLYQKVFEKMNERNIMIHERNNITNERNIMMHDGRIGMIKHEIMKEINKNLYICEKIAGKFFKYIDENNFDFDKYVKNTKNQDIEANKDICFEILIYIINRLYNYNFLAGHSI